MSKDAIVIDPKKAGPVVGVAIVVAFVLIVAFGEKPRPPLVAGDPAPSAHGTTLAGADFDLAQWRGSAVFVSFWATWCGFCLKEFPGIAAAAQKHPEVKVVGLATLSDSSLDEIRTTAAKHALPFAIVPTDHATERAWAVDGFPSNYLVDKDGKLVWVGGTLDAEQAEQLFATASPSAQNP